MVNNWDMRVISSFAPSLAHSSFFMAVLFKIIRT